MEDPAVARRLGLIDTVIKLVKLLQPEPEAALWDLRDVICAAFGDDGRAVGAAFREAGGIGQLVNMLVWWNRLTPYTRTANGKSIPKAQVPKMRALRQLLLEVLGNLCSDAVDTDSLVTKRTLLEAGGSGPLLDCLHDKDVNVVRSAIANLQNLAHDPAWCQVLASTQRHLEQLLKHKDAAIVRYAAGTLRNMQVSSEYAGLPSPKVSLKALQTIGLRQRDAFVQMFRQKRAIKVISTAAKRYKGSRTFRQRKLEAKRAALEKALESQVAAEAKAEAKAAKAKAKAYLRSRRNLPEEEIESMATSMVEAQAEAKAEEAEAKELRLRHMELIRRLEEEAEAEAKAKADEEAKANAEAEAKAKAEAMAKAVAAEKAEAEAKEASNKEASGPIFAELADFLRSPGVSSPDVYDILVADDVKSVSDLALLSEADLAELGLRLGPRKRIRAALASSPPLPISLALPTLAAKGAAAELESERRSCCHAR